MIGENNMVNCASTPNRSPGMTHPNPEVSHKAGRRKFTVRYKQSIVEQADKCTQPGEIEHLLRREGLYSSHLSKWRKLYKSGKLNRKGAADSQDKHVQQLAAENERLRQRLEQAETIIDVQKKLCNLLGLSMGSGH